MNKKIHVLIPARKNSKRLKNKNIIKFKNKELFLWSYISAKYSKLVSTICVSTDNTKIHKICEKKKIFYIKRPNQLSTDKSLVKDTIMHYLKAFKKENRPEIIVLLQPTSPLRERNLIDNGVKKLLSSKKASALVELCPLKLSYGKIIKNFWKSNFKEGARKQDISPLYIPSGRLFIYKVNEHFLKKKKINFTYLVQNYNKNVNIDTFEDLIRLKNIYQNYANQYEYIDNYKL
jgi:CMP-N,N'-diacetyllegionaminic acid synthase